MNDVLFGNPVYRLVSSMDRRPLWFVNELYITNPTNGKKIIRDERWRGLIHDNNTHIIGSIL